MKVVILCGPTCAGKDSIAHCLCQSNKFHKVIRHTTREIREGEKDGVDYYFLTEDEFNIKLAHDEFLIHEYYGNGMAYGTSLTFLENMDSDDIYVLVSNENPYVIERLLIKKGMKQSDIFKIVITAPVGVRLKRYIDRIGEFNFTMKDKIEVCSRLDRDEGMFIGILSDPEFWRFFNTHTNPEEIATRIKERIIQFSI